MTNVIINVVLLGMVVAWIGFLLMLATSLTFAGGILMVLAIISLAWLVDALT